MFGLRNQINSDYQNNEIARVMPFGLENIWKLDKGCLKCILDLLSQSHLLSL